MSEVEFVWEDFNNSLLMELKNKYQLEDIISQGKSEYEKQILLKNWVFNKLKLGYNNTKSYQNALEVLEDNEKGAEFNCSWYVLVYLQCAQALGWYVRKIGIDTDHLFGEEEMRHTVCDIWNEDYKKWYVVDPMMNTHYVKNGKPLNEYEIRKNYLEKHDIQQVFGNNEKKNFPKNIKERFDNPKNYYWFFVLLRNNFIENPDIYNAKALLWEDKYNKDKVWNVGGEHKGEFQKHPMYAGAFIDIGDLNVMFPKMNKIIN